MTLAPTRIAAGFATLVVGGSLLAGCSSAPTSASTPSGAPAATTTSASAAQTSATAPTSAPTASTGAATHASTASTAAPAAAGLTMATVATHNTASSCWTVINKNVYDLTAWINVHPGGATPIKSLCGIDATAKFAEQHGTEKDPNNRLATFKKGALAG